MSDAGRKKIKIGDAVIEYDEPAVPDPRVEAVKRAIDKGVAKFDQCRKPILTALRKGYERGPKSEPFDAANSWNDLRFHAGIYLLRKSAEAEQMTMPAADRRGRLRELADALDAARLRMDEVMQCDVRTDLYSAWWKGTSEHSKENEQPKEQVPIESEFEKEIAGLTALHRAALRAIEDISTTPGRPSGTGVLPYSFVSILAEHFLQSTGIRPGAGPGPFTEFTKEVLAALGRNVPEREVISIVKATRRWDLELRAATKWFSPSAFNQKSRGGKTPPNSR